MDTHYQGCRSAMELTRIRSSRKYWIRYRSSRKPRSNEFRTYRLLKPFSLWALLKRMRFVHIFADNGIELDVRPFLLFRSIFRVPDPDPGVLVGSCFFPDRPFRFMSSDFLGSDPNPAFYESRIQIRFFFYCCIRIRGPAHFPVKMFPHNFRIQVFIWNR